MRKYEISYQGAKYYFEIDDQGYIWLVEGNGRKNFGQYKGIKDLESVKCHATEMLKLAGY